MASISADPLKFPWLPDLPLSRVLARLDLPSIGSLTCVSRVFQKHLGANLFWLAIAKSNHCPINEKGKSYRDQVKHFVEVIRFVRASQQESSHSVSKCPYLGISHILGIRYVLGSCYFDIRGNDADSTKAISWYKEAAELGNIDAQSNLGFYYYYGIGVDEDCVQAVNWYRRAAGFGSADAQYSLGVCYEFGEGVSEDKTVARSWYRKSADQGHAVARVALGGRAHSLITRGVLVAPHLIEELPPYPSKLKEFLALPCPIWKGKTAEETHIVVPLSRNITAVVRGSFVLVPRTLKTLGVVDKYSGGVGYCSIRKEILENDLIRAEEEFCWAVMTKDVLPLSRKGSYDEQKKLVESKGYQVPPILDAVTAILWESRRTGVRPFSYEPSTFTRCREEINGCQSAVGGLDSSGLRVVSSSRDAVWFGMAGFQKF